MRKLLITLGMIAAIFYCRGDREIPKYRYEPKSPSRIEQTQTTQPASLEQQLSEPTIKIASFNIQVFGKAKREKEEVMQVLEKIVRNFDVVAIQEIKDIGGKTVPYFMERINAAAGDKYDYVISPRVGEGAAAESYAFIYNTRTVNFRRISAIYNDSSKKFTRTPFIAAFSSGKFDFTLVNIHTKPEYATREVMALEEVEKYADDMVKDDKDVIVLGDFNADGKYFSEKITTGFRDTRYQWVIPDWADTTVKATNYTYDRIVFRKAFTSEDYAGKWQVLDFKSRYGLTQKAAEKVSDHFPVWALFYTTRDTD